VEGEGRKRVDDLVSQGLRVGWLTFGGKVDSGRPEVLVLHLERKPGAYAAQLYAALHILDEAGVDRIVVELPPPGQEWLAVHDRLRRASTL